MGPLLEFLAVWWWTAPTAVGAGIAGYTGLTTGRRRSRRLALDAARLEEQDAVRALLSAQADTRTARAELAAAQAREGRSLFDGPFAAQARRRLQELRLEQRRASLALRATRGHVRAERQRLHAIGSTQDLPLVRLVREHDSIVAAWLEYETDLESSLAFPQMTDPRHPQTASFLVVMQEAQHLRPPAGATRMLPADFLAYRDAVRRLAQAFSDAEDAAFRASAGSRRPLWEPSVSPTPRAETAAPRPRRDRPVWPVPRRSSPPSAR